ncbi:MAG: hypothetical protein JNM99_21590 [Verrucomicrobiaceae bacterium]|nr:hypothetical protein [Verrucomicrobiaceae bacterium]
MNKRLIFIIVLVVLLVLLCAKFMFEDGTQQSTGKQNQTSNAGKTTPTTMPASNGGSTTRPEANPSTEPPMKLTKQLVAGGRQWKLNFADQSLPEEVRQRIGYDLNLMFGHLPTFEVDVLPFPLEVDGRQLDRRVRFEGGTNRRPKVLMNSGFGHLERGADESNLFVPKSVIAAYNEAIELEKRNEAAYKQLDQMLVRMNELREKPIEDVRSLFVFADDNKSAEGGSAKVDPQEFAASWGGKLYRAPSILDVTGTAGTPLEKYGSLVATTYTMSSGKLDDLPPLVFTNGQWRFLLQRPPT